MMSPYGEFLVDFERKHGDHTHRNDPGNTKAALIIETRPLFFLPKVIRNVMYFLGREWNLHVLTGPMAYDFVGSSLPGWNVHIDVLPWNPIGLSKRDYSRYLTIREFWTWLPEPTVLVFQPDTLLTGPGIEEFLGWDYIGAPCGTFDENYYACGGLSLRSRDAMIAALEGRQPVENEPEDTYFSKKVRQMGGRMPDVMTAARFCLESAYVGHPLGVHGTDKFLHSLDIARTVTAAIAY
ncbi:MAG TPA: DUF5672 family protein [Mycobacteriales bacterium]